MTSLSSVYMGHIPNSDANPNPDPNPDPNPNPNDWLQSAPCPTRADLGGPSKLGKTTG